MAASMSGQLDYLALLKEPGITDFIDIVRSFMGDTRFEEFVQYCNEAIDEPMTFDQLNESSIVSLSSSKLPASCNKSECKLALSKFLFSSRSLSNASMSTTSSTSLLSVDESSIEPYVLELVWAIKSYLGHKRFEDFIDFCNNTSDISCDIISSLSSHPDKSSEDGFRLVMQVPSRRSFSSLSVSSSKLCSCECQCEGSLDSDSEILDMVTTSLYRLETAVDHCLE